MMVRRTVSLEETAYEKLRRAKRPGESFTDTANRLLEQSRPSFRSIAGILSREQGARVKQGIAEMRALESQAEKTKWAGYRRTRSGRHP